MQLDLIIHKIRKKCRRSWNLCQYLQNCQLHETNHELVSPILLDLDRVGSHLEKRDERLVSKEIVVPLRWGR